MELNQERVWPEKVALPMHGIAVTPQAINPGSCASKWLAR